MLRVLSIFSSIDGEANAQHQGRMTVFIRLAGCNYRCSYCDTTRAQKGSVGEELTTEQIMVALSALCPPMPFKVTITGGEPLLQWAALEPLLAALEAEGVAVTIETNGSLALPIPPGDSIYWVVDYKLPSSGHYVPPGEWLPRSTEWIEAMDVVKFVVADEADFDAALGAMKMICKDRSPTFAFSPVWGRMDPARLVELMKKERLWNCVFSLQIHKVLWPQAGEKEEGGENFLRFLTGASV